MNVWIEKNNLNCTAGKVEQNLKSVYEHVYVKTYSTMQLTARNNKCPMKLQTTLLFVN